GGLAGEGAQPPNKACDLCSSRTGIRVCLVENDEPQRSTGKELKVLLTRQEQLELVCIGNQDPRLALADLLLPPTLLRRNNVFIIRAAAPEGLNESVAALSFGQVPHSCLAES